MKRNDQSENPQEVIEEIRLAFEEKVHGANGKVVAIVGAGMSFDVGKLPLGRELAQALKVELGCDFGPLQVLFNKKVDELEKKLHLDRDDFKTILFALNQIDSKGLLNSITLKLESQEIYSTSYDSLAKLMAQGCIDSIINFNFDEILDNTLIRHCNQLQRFVTDADFEGKQFSIPANQLYIKPHGTVSQPETMRFARADYYRIEPRIETLIRNVLSETKTIILLIGFRLRFFDFANIFYESLEPGSKLFIFDPSREVLDGVLDQEFFAGHILISESSSLSSVLDALIPKIIYA